MRIFVANLPYHLTDANLKKLFRIFGVVEFARIIRTPETGESKGFGYVTMQDKSAAKAAIAKLNGCVIRDRKIELKEAAQHPAKSPGK
jgi:RNA recognition motif-containing protein